MTREYIKIPNSMLSLLLEKYHEVNYLILFSDINVRKKKTHQNP